MSKRAVFPPKSFDHETWIVVRYDDTHGLSEIFRAGDIMTQDGEPLAGTGREHLFSVGDPCLAPWKKQGHIPAVVAVISDDRTECLKEKEQIFKSDKTRKLAQDSEKPKGKSQKPNKAASTSGLEKRGPKGKTSKENEIGSGKSKQQASGSVLERQEEKSKSMLEDAKENATSSVKRKKQELHEEAKRLKDAQTAAAQDLAASLFNACDKNSACSEKSMVGATYVEKELSDVDNSDCHTLASQHPPRQTFSTPTTKHVTTILDSQHVRSTPDTQHVPSTSDSRHSSSVPVSQHTPVLVSQQDSQHVPRPVSLSLHGQSDSVSQQVRCSQSSLQSTLQDPASSFSYLNHTFPADQLSMTSPTHPFVASSPLYRPQPLWPYNFTAPQNSFPAFNTYMLPPQEQPWVTSTPSQSNLHENSSSSFLQSLSESRPDSPTDLLDLDTTEQEVDVEKCSPPPSSNPPTTNFNMSGLSCFDCQMKDKEIQDLKNELNGLRRKMSSNVAANTETRERAYKPKTRPDVPLSDYIEIKDASSLPEGYQLLAPGAPIAVRSLWLHQVMASIGRNRERKEKRASKKSKVVREEKETEIIKRLMDGFFEPSELAKQGGTQRFITNPVFIGLKCYATHILKMDIPKFNRCWNTKMATARATVKRLDQ